MEVQEGKDWRKWKLGKVSFKKEGNRVSDSYILFNKLSQKGNGWKGKGTQGGHGDLRMYLPHYILILALDSEVHLADPTHTANIKY